MKKLIISLFIISLSACKDPFVNALEVAQQEQACKEHGGVFRYHGRLSDITTCLNGSRPKWKKIILEADYYPKPEKTSY